MRKIRSNSVNYFAPINQRLMNSIKESTGDSHFLPRSKTISLSKFKTQPTQKQETLQPKIAMKLPILIKNLNKLNQKSKSPKRSPKSKETQIKRIPTLYSKLSSELVPKQKNKLRIGSPHKFTTIQNVEDLQEIIPKQGYIHFRITSIHKSKNPAQLPTLSKNGIIVNFNGKEQFMKTSQYIKIMKIVVKLSDISFWKYFMVIKYFNQWSRFIYKTKMKTKVEEIQGLLASNYNSILFKINNLLQDVYAYRYINLIDLEPIKLIDYPQYLHKNSYPIVNHITNQKFSKVISQYLEPLQNQFVENVKEYISQFNQRYNVTHNHYEYYKSYQFRNCIFDYQRFLKKAFYIFVQSHVGWIKNIIHEILKKIEANLSLYWKAQGQSYKQKLIERLVDDEELLQFKTDYRQIEIKQILIQCKIDDQSSKIVRQQIVGSILQIFTEFLYHLIDKLGSINRCYTETISEMINQIMKTIDVYNSSTIIQSEQLVEQFQRRLTVVISQNCKQVDEIIGIIQCNIDGIEKLLKSNEKNQNFYSLYTDIQDISKRIQLIPNTILVGMIVLDFKVVKNFLNEKVNKINNEILTKTPILYYEKFTEMYNQLKQIYNGISLTTWKIQDFVSSHRYREKFDDYKEKQYIQKVQKLKSILRLLDKIFHDRFEEYYMKFLKIPQLFTLTQNRSQSFDLKCVEKLKYFIEHTNNLKDEAKYNLIQIQTKLIDLLSLEKKSTINIELLLEGLPQLKIQIDKVGQKIKIVKYVQMLQSNYCIITQKLSQFASFEKIRNDITLLVQCLNQFQNFTKIIEKNYNVSMFQLRTSEIIEKIQQYLIQMKHAKRSLAIYEDFIKYVVGKCKQQLNLMEIVRDLALFQQQQLQDIENRKYFNFSQKNIYTLKDIIDSGIANQYEEIHIALLKKQKKRRCQSLLLEIDDYLSQMTLEIKKQQGDDREIYFIQIDTEINTIEELSNQIEILVNSSLIKIQKYELKQKQLCLLDTIGFFNSIETAQQKINQICQYFQKNDGMSKRGEQLQFRKHWNMLMEKLQKKQLHQILQNLDEYRSGFDKFIDKINQKLLKAQKRVKQIQRENPILYFLQDFKILQLIKNPLLLFYEFYPVSQALYTQNADQIKLFTYLRQQITININGDLIFKSFIQQLHDKIKNLMLSYSENYNLDLIAKIPVDLPLQIIYTVDQIYLTKKSANTQALQNIKMFQAQIKHFLDLFPINEGMTKYTKIAFEILVASRIQHRSRWQATHYTWVPQIFTYQLKNNNFYIRIFNSSILICYDLIDSNKLKFFFPHCQKTLLKYIEIFNDNINAFVPETDIVELLSARMGYIYRKFYVTEQNIKNIMQGLSSYRIFAVGVSENWQAVLPLIFEAYNQIKIQLKEKEQLKSTKNFHINRKSMRLPMIFLEIDPKKFKIPKHLRCFYREISQISLPWSFIIEIKSNLMHMKLSPTNIKQAIDILKFYEQNYQLQKNSKPSMKTVWKAMQILLDQMRDIKIKSLLLVFKKSFDKLFRNLNKQIQYENYAKSLMKEQIPSFSKTNSKIICPQENIKIEEFRKKLPQIYAKNAKLSHKMYEIHEYLKNQWRIIILVGAPGVGKTYTYENYIKWQNSKPKNKPIQPVKINLQALSYLEKIQDASCEDIFLKVLEQNTSKWLIIQKYNLWRDSFYFQDVFIKKEVKLKNNSSVKISRDQRIIFQITSLSNLSPATVLESHIVSFEQNSNDWIYVFQEKFNEFSRTIEWKNQFLKQTQKIIVSTVQEFFDNLQTLPEIAWLAKLDHSIIIRNALILFLSYSNNHLLTFQNLIHIRSTTIIKILFYCVFTIINLIIKKQHKKQIEKFTRQCMSNVDGCSKQGFLNKIISFKNGDVQFYHLKNCEFENDRNIENMNQNQLNEENIIMKNTENIYSMSIIKTLYRNHHNILIYGRPQSGKTSLIKLATRSSACAYLKIILTYENSFKEINQSIMQHRFNKTGTSIKTQQKIYSSSFHEKLKNIQENLVVIIENIGFTDSEHPGQTYLKTISQSSSFYCNRSIIKTELINLIIEKRQVQSASYLVNNWHLFPIIIGQQEHDIQKIYSILVENICKKYCLCDPFDTPISVAKNKKQINGFSKRIANVQKYCLTNLKTTPQNWIYWFNFQGLYSFLKNFKCYPANDMEQLFTVLQTQFYQRYAFRIKDKFQSLGYSAFFQRQFQQITINNNLQIHKAKRQQKDVIDTFLQQKIYGHRQSGKILIYPQLLQNLKKIYKSAKRSNVIFLNRQIIYDMGDFTPIALELCGVKYFSFDIINSYKDFIDAVEKSYVKAHRQQQASKKQIYTSFQKHQAREFIYFSLPMVRGNPKIISYLQTYIRSVKQQQVQTASIKFDKKKNRKDKKKTFGFIVEYDLQNQQIKQQFLISKSLINEAEILWIQQPSIESLSSILEKVSQKKNSDVASHTSKISILFKLYEQMKSFFSTQNLYYRYILDYNNYLAFITQFQDNFHYRLNQLQSKKRAIQSCLSEISFIFQQYQGLKKQQISLSQQRKKCMQKLVQSKQSYMQVAKKLQQFESSKYFDTIQNKKKSVNQKKQYISSLKQQQANLKTSTTIFFNYISRAEIAEVKYLYNNSLAQYKEFFEAIAILIGQNPQYYSMKKMIMDTNFMAKLKDCKINKKSKETLEIIYAKIYPLQKKDMIAMKNLFQWVKAGSKLGLVRYAIEEAIPVVKREIEQLETEIVDIQQKFMIGHLLEQGKALEQSIDQLEKKLKNIQQLRTNNQKIFKNLGKFNSLMSFNEHCKAYKLKTQSKIANLIQQKLEKQFKIFFSSAVPSSQRPQLSTFLASFVRKNFIEYKNFSEQYQFQNVENILKPKSYLSKNQLEFIVVLNQYLEKNKKMVMVIDSNNSLQNCIENKNILVYTIDQIVQLTRNGKFTEQNKIIIIELSPQQWAVEKKIQSSKYKLNNKVSAFYWKNSEVSFLQSNRIIFVKTRINKYHEKMRDFQIVYLDFNEEDYMEQITNIMMKEHTNDKFIPTKLDIYKLQEKLQENLLNTVELVCKQCRMFSVHNLKTLDKILLKTEQWQVQLQIVKQKKKENSTSQKSFLEKYDKRVSQVSKMFTIMKKFPEFQQVNNQVLLEIVKQGWQFEKHPENDKYTKTLNFIFTLFYHLVEDKNLFLFQMYFKFYCFNYDNASILDVQNICFEIDALETISSQMSNIINEKNSNCAVQNIMKMPIKNNEMQNFVRKLFAKDNPCKQTILNKIQSAIHFTPYKKLLLKKLLLPDEFQNQYNRLIGNMKKQLLIDDKKLLCQYLSRTMIYVKCDTSYWLRQLQLRRPYTIMNLGLDITDVPVENFLILEDKCPSKDLCRKYIQNLITRQKNIIIFSQKSPPMIDQIKYILLSIEQFLAFFSYECQSSNEIIKKIIEYTSIINPNESGLQLWYRNNKLIEVIQQIQEYAPKNQPEKIATIFQWKYFNWYQPQTGYVFDNVSLLIESSFFPAYVKAKDKKLVSYDWNEVKFMRQNRWDKIKTSVWIGRQYYRKMVDKLAKDLEQLKQGVEKKQLWAIQSHTLISLILTQLSKIKAISDIKICQKPLTYQFDKKYQKELSSLSLGKLKKYMKLYINIKKQIQAEKNIQLEIQEIQSDNILLQYFGNNLFSAIVPQNSKQQLRNQIVEQNVINFKNLTLNHTKLQFQPILNSQVSLTLSKKQRHLWVYYPINKNITIKICLKNFGLDENSVVKYI